MRMHAAEPFVRCLSLALLALMPAALSPRAAAQAAGPLFGDLIAGVPDVEGLADLNGDGRQDLLCLNFATGNVSVFLATGTATFVPGASLFANGEPLGVAAADVDEDGDQDVLVASGNQGLVTLLLGDGAGGLTHAGAVLPPNALSRVDALQVADFDADGHADLAYGMHFDAPGGNTFYDLRIGLGHGDGTFTQHAAPPTNHEKAFAVADFDHDGRLDLAALAFATIDILLGQGDGSFVKLTTVTSGISATSMKAGDVNGDGDTDLVTASSSLHAVRVQLGHGDGTFSALPGFAVSEQPFGLDVADLDADGRDDVLVSQFEDVFGVSFGTVLLSGPTGAVSSVTDLSTGYGKADLIHDFDGDGIPDLLLGAGTSTNVLLGLGDGSFFIGTASSSGPRPQGIVIADFDNDGKSDVATANDMSTAPASVLLGQGDGTFPAHAEYGGGAGAFAIVAGDWNADGAQDLAELNDAATGPLSILLGAGDGSFTAGASLLGGTKPAFLASGDFNGDGRQDLAAASTTPKQLNVLLGQADGTFTAAPLITLSKEPTGIAAGDWNGDGRVDLAASIAGKVIPYLGAGDGSFAFNPDLIVTEGGTGRLAPGDFNGDGRQDLVSANTSSTVVLLGLPNGSFATAVLSSAYAAYPTVCDLDGDGRLDILTHTGGLTNVLLGHGDGTFGAGEGYVLPAGYFGVADFDQDGRQDVAATTFKTNAVTVHLNLSPAANGKWVGLGAALAGSKGMPALAGSGPLLAGSPVSITLANAKASSPALLFVGLSSLPTPFKGGTLLPVPMLLSLGLTTSVAGGFTLPLTWPAAVPSGFSVVYQSAIQDAAAVKGVALSNGLQSTTP